MIGIIVIVLFGVIPQIITSLTDLVNFIPTAAQQLYHFFDTLEERFPSLDTEVLRNTINNAIPNFINYAKDFAANMIPALYSISMSILKWVLNLFIAIMVSIYMLADKRPLVNSCKAVVYAFVPVKYIQLILDVSAEANRLFSSFIVGKAIDSTIIGVLCFVLMLILRLPYAVLISVIVGITNMIPYFGPFIGAIPSAIILLFISPLKAVIFVVMVFVLQQFDGLDPRTENPRRFYRSEAAVDHLRHHGRRQYCRGPWYVPRCSGSRIYTLSDPASYQPSASKA